jgi:hypothetical protein
MYRDHLMLLLKSQLDKYLATEVHIQKNNVQVSFIRSFPNANVTLHQVLVKSAPSLNTREFDFQARDTLLYADELSLIFNLGSFVTKRYELKRIVVKSASVNILSDYDGNRNYIVFRTSEKNGNDSLRLNLSEIQLRQATLHYIDLKSDIHVRARSDKTILAVQFNGDDFECKIDTRLEGADLVADKSTYLDNAVLKGKLTIQKKAEMYTFTHGNFSLFGTDILFSGEYNDRTRNYNFSAGTDQANFSRITYPVFLSNLKMAGLKAESGRLDAFASIAGVSGKTSASVKIGYKLTGAAVRTLQKNTRISNIYLEGKYDNGKYRKAETSQIQIDSIYAISGKSTLFGSVKVTNLLKPGLVIDLAGKLELEKLMEIKVLARRFYVSGMLEGRLRIQGSVSGFNKLTSSDAKKLVVQGRLSLVDGYIKSLVNPLPAAYVSGTLEMNNTQEIFLKGVRLTIGKSDMLLDGKIANLLFFSGNREIFPEYSCNVSSDVLYIEDFLVPTGMKKNETQQMVHLPDSMKVSANIKVKEFHFGKFQATEVSGELSYYPKTLNIRNFSMLSQGGKIQSEIKLNQTGQRLVADCNANMQNVDIGDMFFVFNNFSQDVIEAENLDGTLTGNARVHAAWDVFLNPLLGVLEVEAGLEIVKGELVNYQPMLGLSRFIEVDELKHIKFNTLNTTVVIKDQVVYIPQTRIQSSAIVMDGSGEHRFDNSYEYRMQIQLSDILWKKTRKNKPDAGEFGYIVDDGLGRTSIPLIIRGKDTEFEVKYDRATAGSTLRKKIMHEGETWRELLGKDDPENSEVKTEIRLEWEDPSTDETVKEKKEKVKTDDEGDFFIEWQDD